MTAIVKSRSVWPSCQQVQITCSFCYYIWNTPYPPPRVPHQIFPLLSLNCLSRIGTLLKGDFIHRALTFHPACRVGRQLDILDTTFPTSEHIRLGIGKPEKATTLPIIATSRYTGPTQPILKTTAITLEWSAAKAPSSSYTSALSFAGIISCVKSPFRT